MREMHGLVLRALAAVFLALILYSAVSQIPPAVKQQAQREAKPQVVKAETETEIIAEGGVGKAWSPQMFIVNLGLSLALGFAAYLVAYMRQR